MTHLPESVLTGRPSARLSTSYGFIDTRPLVETALAAGFQVTSAMATRSRRDPASAKHMVRLRPSGIAPVNGVYPELVIVNSHNGTSTLRVFAGLFRLVCSNGLIVADATFAPPLILRHNQTAQRHIAPLLLTSLDQVQAVVERIPQFVGTGMTMAAQQAYAERAATLSATPINPEHLLRARRSEDTASDLWTIYNRVQENLMRGGLPTMRPNARRLASTRSITSITRDMTINTALWSLTNEFLEA